VDMAITHVVRGDDHISNTPKQVLLYHAMGAAVPAFAHVPLILGPDKKRLSKRHGATSVEEYEKDGILPEAMVNFLALLGWSFDGQRELFSLAELEQVFRLDRVGSNPAIFNLEKLSWMNGQHMKMLPEEERVRRAVAFLEAHGHDLSARAPEWRAMLVRAIGDRLKILTDAERYGVFALKDALEIEPEAWAGLLQKPEVGPRLAELARRIAAVPAFDLEALEQATRGLAKELGIKAGDLMSAARVALTGRTVAPGLFEVMTLLGRERAVARLRTAAERWVEESPQARV